MQFAQHFCLLINNDFNERIVWRYQRCNQNLYISKGEQTI